MSVTPMISPLPGEHVLDVQPTMAPEVDAGWHRRLRLYTGRTLSDTALKSEQAGRAGRLATRGQLCSPGIVFGLELVIDQVANNQLFYQISPGLGIAASGEDVVMLAGGRINILDVRVQAPTALLQGALPPGQDPATSGYLANARDVGPPLDTMIQSGVNLPRVGILVLQPLVLEMIGRVEAQDPCERDPQNDAFDDWQLADGCRLLYYAWPTDLLQLPPWPSDPQTQAQWRNQIAYTIFDAELERGPDSPLPWEDIGVPVGLVGFDPNWQFQFLDRYAVVRGGGKPKRRSQITTSLTASTPPLGTNNPFLWQARMQQLAEQIADASRTPITDLSRQFAFLPPAGLLPRTAVELLNTEAASQREPPVRIGLAPFFPSTIHIDAVPIPTEQLDLALEASASLAPIDLNAVDQLRVLVPVPQIWYEPHLLQVAQVDAEFQESLDRLIIRRGRWLNRRLDLRAKANALALAITGAALIYPDPDPQALEPEQVASDPIDPNDPLLKSAELDYGTGITGSGRVALALIALRERLAQTTPLARTSAVALDSLPDAILAALKRVSGQIDYNKQQKQLTFLGRMDDKIFERLHDALKQAAGPNDQNMDRYQEALDRLHAETQSPSAELAQLDALGLARFIDLLQQRVNTADDRVNFSFLRAQSDIYRVRQLVLGNTNGTRLATSQALASIAQGESAVASREQLSSFYEGLEATKYTPPATTPDKDPVKDSPFVPINRVFATLGERALPSFLDLPVARQVQSNVRSALLSQAAQAAVIAPVKQDASPIDVIGQQPVIGASDIRMVTVAERLAAAKAPEAKSFTVSSKYDVVKILKEIDLNLDDIAIPGVPDRNADESPLFDSVGQPKRKTKLLSEIDLERDILNEPSPQKNDEAAYFVGAVELLDHTIATLRLVEGRVQQYRQAIAACQQTLTELRGQAAQVGRRLAEIGDELAETRHDVSLARALLADEITRITAINARRDQIIAEQVRFLAFHRPRWSELRIDTPARTLDPGIVEPFVPACLGSQAAAPPALRAMVELLRDAPVRWFTHLPRLLDRLDRLPMLTATMQSAWQRANQLSSTFNVPVYAQPMLIAAPSAVASLGPAITKVQAAQEQALMQVRTVTAQLDIGALANQSWLRVRDQAASVVALGDLINGSHGRSDVAQAAASELEQIGQVAACLYRAFGNVLPILRLEWAERLSQYDAPVNLRNLASLPRWGENEFLQRRAMQEQADWLYARVDAQQSDAVAMINDLVRVCILLASHAPVNQIIAGHVTRDTTVRPAGRITLTAFDPTQVRIGMQVLLYQQSQVVAHGIVEDLAADQVATKIIALHTQDERGQPATSLTLAAGAQAHFTEI